jgi:hypothetical protein
MDYANYWASAVATADLGEPIDQSLRFRGGISGSGYGGYLSKAITPSSTTAALTISFWVKLGNIPSGYNRNIFSSGTSGSDSGNITYDNSSDEAYIRFQDTSSFTAFTTQKLRDFSAWYHIVYRFDAANQYVKVYVNGSEHSNTTIATSARTSFGATSPMQIGRYADGPTGGYGNNYWDGYLADWNMLFGTSLGPDSFGRTNDDGVWVPEDLSSLTSNQYGALGNRLVFDSSAGLGDDTAPTGGTHASANDFTASGFDTAEVRKYSEDLSLDASSTESATHVFERAFDNNTSTIATNNEVTGSFTFNPNPAISYSSSVKVRVNDSGGSPTATIGSTSVNLTANSLTTVVSGSGSFGAGGDALVIANTVSNPQLCQIEVDGTVLVDNTDNDVDYKDTPTSNYATWNRLSALPANVTFTDANLRIGTIASQAWTPGYLTFGPFECGKPGKYYFEMNDDEATGVKTCNFGVTDNLNITWSDWWWNTGNTLSWYPENGLMYRNGTGIAFGSASTSTGKAMAINFEAGTIDAYNGGTLVGSLTSLSGSSALVSGKQYYIVAATSNSSSTTMPFNFGQMPFIFTPPTGYSALETNNLTEPTIKNGKDHFDTVTYTGSSSAKTVTGLEFQPDLIWFKSTSHSTSHALFDSVRGTSAGYLMSDDGGAEETSNGTLTSFNSDGFTTGVPVSNEYNNGSGRNYVAWCWKAGGAAVSNGNGSITSSVSANTDAGFSIVSYTGTGSAATIGHGLNSPPECILVKNRDSSADWAVYHVGLDATAPEDKYIVLNTDAAVVDAVDRWNDTAPTSTVFTVGNALQTNGADDMIAYCWHSVEGYSKFGKYAGNDNADGPFVYTGFRPAMIILKSIGLGYDWFIWDTTRDTSNPSDTTLKPDLTQDETTASSPTQTIDILSNGFKIRDNRQNNQLTDYLYCAWAENPFGGENVPPATAR